MTDKQYVIRAAQMKGLSLIQPKRNNPGILAFDPKIKPHPIVIDAQTWSKAREQMNQYYMEQAK